MVLEKNHKETQDFSFRSCSGTVEYDENAWDENKGLQINPMDQNCIEITNITDNTVTDIQIYYKTIYPQDLFYIGGITNCYRIHSICAGESMIVSPEHFASKQSKIVCVKTGKT